jgi:hypothetical protein
VPTLRAIVSLQQQQHASLTCCMLVSLSCTSKPPCTMGNRFCLSGFLLALMQRSSHLVVR